MINRRSRLTTLVPNNNLWNVKEPLALFEKSRAWSSRCQGLYLIRAVIGLGGWGEIIYGLRQQPEAPSIC